MKKFNSLILFSLSIIILSSSAIHGNSQTVDPATYNGSYKAKIGDSNRYDVLKIKNQSNDFLTVSYQSSNGSFVLYNVTKGVYITFVITTINTSTYYSSSSSSSSFISSNTTTVYGNENIYIPGHKTIHLNETSTSGILNPGFDHYTDAESYYNQSPEFGKTSNISRHGDFIEFSSNVFANSNTSSSYTQEFNWKTGWLESLHIKIYDTNGTVLLEESLQRHSDNSLIRSITNLSINVLEIGSIGIIFSIPVLIGFSYKSYSKLSKTTSNSQSFPKYLQSKVHYSKKNIKKKTAYSTDKALKTIESILEETDTHSK